MADRFDLDAIEADDALLDLLAAGGESARTAGEHDPAVALLADLRLAVEVEDELPVETIDDPESFLARCAALNPITDPFARKVATRGLAFGVAAVAALSVSGVAAAVTGDPLSPYEKVIEKMVDAVRPQTSFPKEELDGLPIVDRSTIVKVGKDFKEKAKAQRAAENGKDSVAGDGELAQDGTDKPEALGFPTDDKPSAILTDKDVLPVKPDQQKLDPAKPTTEVTEPTDTTTTKPADPKTSEPTDAKTETPPDTPPSTPTDQPTDTPTDTPTPTPTDTTTPPTVDDGTGDSNTSTGEPTSTPTGTPSAGSGEGQTSDGETTGSDSTTPAGDTVGTGGSDTSGSDTSGSDTSGDGEKPGSEVTQVPPVPAEVKELVDVVESIVLPTPSGEPVENQTAERFFGTPDAVAQSVTTSKATAKKAAGKHASGKVSTGSVRQTYPKGKHSSGAYPEGKHAAIARTYGSTTDASLLQILDVVNKPIR